jgi:hypothetical protein
MRWNPAAYGPEIAAILALDGNGERFMSLADPHCVSEDARGRIALARIPETLRAGLYLYFGCWTDAHEVAQGINTREGSYWHAMVHRQEPDAGNAGYWFGQVGTHPIYAELGELANEPGLAPWNPRKFIDYCERARRESGSAMERRAQELQQLEWQLLFDYCAKRQGQSS